MDLEASHTQGIAEILHGELAQVVVLGNRGDLHAVADELVAQLRRRRPLGTPDQLDEQPQPCAVYSGTLGSGAETFADALRVRLVTGACRAAERAHVLRVRLAGCFVEYAARLVDPASEADVRPTGGSPVDCTPAVALLVVHVT